VREPGRTRRERRALEVPGRVDGLVPLGHAAGSTPLHEERLDAVEAALRREGVASVVDLGCGAGALLLRLARDPRYRRIVGVDGSIGALGAAERALAEAGHRPDGRISLVHADLLEVGPRLSGADAVVLVETLEHLDPGELSRLERTLFRDIRPRVAVITTPDADYNPRLGLAEGERRHADHRFEWGGRRFDAWASGVAGRSGYAVTTRPVGAADPWLGSPTRLAVFRRLPDGPAAGEGPL
jgi:small RNA 2'-O-methyltransferase